MAKRKLLKNIESLSLGLVLVLVWAWMWLRADQLFLVNTVEWVARIQFYMIFTAFIFAWDTAVSRKVESPIFEVAFIRAFPKFLLSGGITLAILFIFSFIYQGTALGDIKTALAVVGLGVILLHAFFISILEEKVFRNWLPAQLKFGGFSKNIVWFLQALIFAFFHYSLNQSLLTIVIYIPLGYLFMWVKEKYSPRTDMANAGVHFAWNVFILGFLS